MVFESTILKHNVLTIRLLVKDHKDPDENGEFPIWLVVPAKNFTAGFPHVDQQGIKGILDRNKINYTKKTIIQASDLKDKVEQLNIKKSTNSIILVDTKKMYPSVKFEMIERAVNLFLADTSHDGKKSAKQCLDMFKFGMDNTFVTFEDQYYIYGGFLTVEEKGPTIGGFESAFFADLVAAYILEWSQTLFINSRFYILIKNDI